MNKEEIEKHLIKAESKNLMFEKIDKKILD
jgi:hypothetical protein